MAWPGNFFPGFSLFPVSYWACFSHSFFDITDDLKANLKICALLKVAAVLSLSLSLQIAEAFVLNGDCILNIISVCTVIRWWGQLLICAECVIHLCSVHLPCLLRFYARAAAVQLCAKLWTNTTQWITLWFLFKALLLQLQQSRV